METQAPEEAIVESAPASMPMVQPAPVSMPAPVKPQVDIAVSLQESGLVLVETSRDKSSVPPPSEPEVRLGRKPKPAAIISNEPLMLVETHK